MLLQREQAMGSGLDHGIAEPHCRSDAVNAVVGAVALVRDVRTERP